VTAEARFGGSSAFHGLRPPRPGPGPSAGDGPGYLVTPRVRAREGGGCSQQAPAPMIADPWLTAMDGMHT
jgi:hypothetical protein